ncbi:Uncharacterised protein [Vibrio cholerae]|nr:Uncharacterised protein [Vibrio cholerae]
MPRSSSSPSINAALSSANSTKRSVSGRGISVEGETFSGSDQNSRSPRM